MTTQKKKKETKPKEPANKKGKTEVYKQPPKITDSYSIGRPARKPLSGNGHFMVM